MANLSKAKKRLERIRVSLPQKVCRHKPCSRPFTPKRRDQIYCGDKCRKADYYTPAEYTKECAACHKSFITTCPTKQIYCKELECVEKRKGKARTVTLELFDEYNNLITKTLIEPRKGYEKRLDLAVIVPVTRIKVS